MLAQPFFYRIFRMIRFIHFITEHTLLSRHRHTVNPRCEYNIYLV